MSTEKPVQLVEVELAGEHTHKGVDYSAGAKIKVTPKQKDFLQEAGKLKGSATKADPAATQEA